MLKFFGYFKETVHESQQEYYRVRPVEIFYYLEDDSISVVEPHVENAGMPQVLRTSDSNKSLLTSSFLPSSSFNVQSRSKSVLIKSNQIFHYTRCVTPKHVASLQAHLQVIVPACITAPFEEMSQRGQDVGNTVFDLIGPRFEP